MSKSYVKVDGNTYVCYLHNDGDNGGGNKETTTLPPDSKVIYSGPPKHMNGFCPFGYRPVDGTCKFLDGPVILIVTIDLILVFVIFLLLVRMGFIRLRCRGPKESQTPAQPDFGLLDGDLELDLEGADDVPNMF